MSLIWLLTLLESLRKKDLNATHWDLLGLVLDKCLCQLIDKRQEQEQKFRYSQYLESHKE